VTDQYFLLILYFPVSAFTLLSLFFVSLYCLFYSIVKLRSGNFLH